METIEKVEIKDEDIQEEDFSQEELADDETDWKAKALESKGIAKRRATQLKKAKEALAARDALLAGLQAKPEAPEKKSDEFGLLEKTFLRSAGYVDSEEIELFKKWHEETKKPLDELVEHPFVKMEIEKMRTAKANQTATSNVRGEAGSSVAKDTPEYWIVRGELPEKTAANRELRAKIARMTIAQTKEGKKFYNE